MSLGGHIALCKADVLYLGSAVPIETAVGIEAFQMPCRERYWSALDNNMKVDGIDSSVIVYSSGLLMQYTGDRNSVTWFPVQSLHACAAVKAASDVGIDGRPRFVALDSAEGAASPHASMFCAIMRRMRGIKVLECHVFICKSTEAALTLVQGMTHAFEHREGWLPDDSLPPIISSSTFSGGGANGTPIVPASRGGGGVGGGVMQKYSINAPTPVPQSAQTPAPTCPVPAQPAPACPVPTPPAPGAVPAIQYLPVPLQNQYFSNWDMCGGQAMMFIPETPFNPDPGNKKKKKKKKKNKKKCKDDSDEDEEEEEVYVLKKQGNYREEEPQRYISRDHRRVPDDLVIYAPSQNGLIDPADEYYFQDGERQNYLTDYDYYGKEYVSDRPRVTFDLRESGNDYGGAPAQVGLQQYYEDNGSNEAMIREAAARYNADRDAAEYYNAVQEYNRALAENAAGQAAFDVQSDVGYPVDYRDYPYEGYRPSGYGPLVDGLGYYP